MNDFRDLKAIAEACQQHRPLRFMRSHGALYIRNDNGIVFDVHQNRSFPEFMAQNKDYADLVLAANPATILAMFAEIERLQRAEKNDLIAYKAVLERQHELREERDQLRAEIAGLRTGHQAYERVKAELKAEVEWLRKDAERYRWTSIEGNWVARMFGKWRAHIGAYGDASPTDWYPTREEAIDAAMAQGEQS